MIPPDDAQHQTVREFHKKGYTRYRWEGLMKHALLRYGLPRALCATMMRVLNRAWEWTRGHICRPSWMQM